MAVSFAENHQFFPTTKYLMAELITTVAFNGPRTVDAQRFIAF
jgi:hypothetical protein